MKPLLLRGGSYDRPHLLGLSAIYSLIDVLWLIDPTNLLSVLKLLVFISVLDLGNDSLVEMVAGMGIGMLVSTLVTRSMGLGYTTSPTGTATKGHGLKAGNRVLECTLSETGTSSVVSGALEC